MSYMQQVVVEANERLYFHREDVEAVDATEVTFRLPSLASVRKSSDDEGEDTDAVIRCFGTLINVRLGSCECEGEMPAAAAAEWMATTCHCKGKQGDCLLSDIAFDFDPWFWGSDWGVSIDSRAMTLSSENRPFHFELTQDSVAVFKNGKRVYWIRGYLTREVVEGWTAAVWEEMVPPRESIVETLPTEPDGLPAIAGIGPPPQEQKHDGEEITEDEFNERYPLVSNHLNPDAAWDGCLFDTDGPEYEFVCSQDLRMVWTLVDDGDHGSEVVSGLWHVNRLGFLVSKVPVEQGKSVSVKLEASEEDGSDNEEFDQDDE